MTQVSSITEVSFYNILDSIFMIYMYYIVLKKSFYQTMFIEDT